MRLAGSQLNKVLKNPASPKRTEHAHAIQDSRDGAGSDQRLILSAAPRIAQSCPVPHRVAMNQI